MSATRRLSILVHGSRADLAWLGGQQLPPGWQVEWILVPSSPGESAAGEVGIDEPDAGVTCAPVPAVVVPAMSAPAASLRAGIALAHGAWLLLLDEGDRLVGGALLRLLAEAEQAGTDAVLAGPATRAAALAALMREPRTLAGSLVRLELVRAAGAPSAEWRDAWELDLWLRMLPWLREIRATEATLAQRGGGAIGREHDVVLARALVETPPGAWALTDAAGRPLDEAEACAELARCAASRAAGPCIGAAASLWLRGVALVGERNAAVLGQPPPALTELLPGAFSARALRLEAAAGLCEEDGCEPLLDPWSDSVDRAAPAPGPKRGIGCRGVGALDAGVRAASPARSAAERSADGDSAARGGAGLSLVLETRSLDRGGLESVVVELALGLRAAGARVAVVCSERGGTEVERLCAAGLEVRVLGASDPAAELAAWLDARDVDLWNAHFSVLGTRLAAERGIPVVVTLHNEYAWVPNDPESEITALDPFVDGYVAVSADVASFCSARFDLSPERIRVIRNACLTTPTGEGRPASSAARTVARAALGIPAEAELLLQVGRVDAVKAPLVLVEAVAQLAAVRPRLRACIVGPLDDREYARRLEARIAEGGLADRVSLLGRRHDVGSWLAAADVFVLPSVIEGLSLAAVEALAAGVPAVLTRTGDAAFLLGEGIGPAGEPLPGALLVQPPIDPRRITPEGFHELVSSPGPARAAELAASLHAVLDDLPRCAAAAKRRAAELAPLFAGDRMIAEYYAFFREVVARAAPLAAQRLAQRIAGLEVERALARVASAELRAVVRELLKAEQAWRRERRRGDDAWRRLAEIRAEVDRANALLGPAALTLERASEKLGVAGRLRDALRAVWRRAPGDA